MFFLEFCLDIQTLKTSINTRLNREPNVQSLTTDELDQIKAHLFDKRFQKAGSTVFPAIVTYIGQMIAHDILPATNWKIGDRPKNSISPFLNLDSIYGQEKCPKVLVREGILDEETLCFNYTEIPSAYSVTGYDYPRLSGSLANGTNIRRAKTLEPRNDENTIIAQFTLWWMRLHNYLIKHVCNQDFEQTKSYVIKTFQLVTIEVFLKCVCDENVHKHFFGTQPVKIKKTLDLNTGIPEYFALASFKLGHSMVRGSYDFAKNRKRRARPRFFGGSSLNIFRKHKKLTPFFCIDFKRFFLDFEKAQKSSKIDSRLAIPMQEIKNQHSPLVNIATRNLDNAILSRQPNSKKLHTKMSQLFGIEHPSLVGKYLSEKEIRNVWRDTPKDAKFLKKLPMWLYVLTEAESQNEGQKLGKFGSVINSYVLFSSIAQSEYSVVEKDGSNETYHYSKFNALKQMDLWGEMISECDTELNPAKLLVIMDGFINQ